jgi:hypothetical protein
MSDDPSYYATRASEERRLAMASADQNVRRIHLEMAAKYDSLASPNAIVATEVPAEPEQRSA